MKTNENIKTPSFIVSIVPFLSVIILTYVLQKVFSVGASVAAFSTQVFAIVLMIVLCNRSFSLKKSEALIAGTKRGTEFMVPAACLVGFASVVTDTQIYARKGLCRNLAPYV